MHNISIRLIKFFLIGILFLSFSSCKKEVEERISGEWDYEVEYKYTYVGVTETIISKGINTFYSNGLGNQSTPKGIHLSFSWKQEGDFIIMDFDEESQGGVSHFEYEVVENKKSKQLWVTSVIEVYDSIVYNPDVLLRLTRR